MRIKPLCPACLLNRAYLEAKMVTNDKNKINKAIEEALKILSEEYPKKGINAVIATRMHRRVYEVLGTEDPYAELKRRANLIAMKALPEVQRFIEKQDDKFKAAALASIIANTFDYGVLGHKVEEDFLNFFFKEYKKGLKIDHLEKIRELVKNGYVVYLTDNAGEIVIDGLFVKEIKKLCKWLTVVVRGKPILNDATADDALIAKIDKIADELLSNGLGAIGIIEEELPPITLSRLENADIIIAKGMANYECLSEGRFKPIAFLLTAKCEPVAEDIGVEIGDMVAILYS